MNFSNNHKGQSLIEFLLCFVYMFGIFFVVLKIALNFTSGYLVHYATFMSARAFLVADNNSNTAGGSDGYAARVGREVFENYRINRVLSTSGDLSFKTATSGDSLAYRGAVYVFRQDFSPLSFMGKREEMNMVSESFLGREPTRAECLERICDAFKEIGGNCELHSTFYDDGC